MAAMLKVYADRLSQPSLALIIFCRVNKLDFEEVTVNVGKGQHRTPEFKKINPMGQVPAIVDGRFRLFESHAILRYLATVFPGVPDHWYPVDLFTRAKVESILDWHHSNLRHGAGDTKFLNGNPQPSIVDLSLVCEIMQLELVGGERRDSILGPREKIGAWMENVKKATSPHFEEAHELIFKMKARLSSADRVKTVSKL